MRKKISLLLAIGLTVILSLAVNLAKAQLPVLSVNPLNTVGDLTPAPDSVFSMTVDVADVPDPGLYGYQFYLNVNPPALGKPIVPIKNMNFTTQTDWTTSTTGTGWSKYGYTSPGNPYGSGGQCYYQRANSTTGITFITEQSFTIGAPWVGTPVWVGVSFAYNITGNSIPTNGVYITMRVVNGTTGSVIGTIIPSKYFSAEAPWSYNITQGNAVRFSNPGVYRFQIRTILKTVTTGIDRYVQLGWDDVGLKIAPINVAEGPFLLAGGVTSWEVKYLNDTTLYISNTLVGTPYIDAFPVTGSGTLATLKYRVHYGATWLDLVSTLLTIGPPPTYRPIPMDHTPQDGWFDNRIPGDSDGNGVVSISDAGVVSDNWGSTTAPFCDWDRNGVISIADAGIVSDNWGRSFSVDP